MYYDWQPYVPVAQRIANARRVAVLECKKQGRELSPVQASGRRLTKNFWGQAWCDHLDQISDFANRLPRGRRYLSNGSVVDLNISKGRVEAVVAGTEVYRVQITITALASKTWKSLQRECAKSIHSLLDLLQGRFDEGVMRRLVEPQGGLFPQRGQIQMRCNCPDYAGVCKHIAAVMYGVGVRFDNAPELLFVLRGVDHTELISQAMAAENLEQTLAVESESLAGADLESMFGIELGSAPEKPPAEPAAKRRARKTGTAVRVNAVKPVPSKATRKKRSSPSPKGPRQAAVKKNAKSL